MTRAEYVILLTEAKRSAIVDRWTPLANGADGHDVASCKFCNVNLCKNCALKDYGYICCKNWEEFINAYREQSDNIHHAAISMLARIEAVDVEAWADHLVEKGVLNDG